MKPKIKRREKIKEKKQFYYSQLNLGASKDKEAIIKNCVGTTKSGMSVSGLRLAKTADQSLSNNFVCKDCGNFSKTGLIAGRCIKCNAEKMIQIRNKENMIHRRLAKALR